MLVHIMPRAGWCTLALFVLMLLSGCGGEEGNNVVPPHSGGLAATSGMRSVLPDTPTRVDLSPFVRGQAASLSAMSSAESGCAAGQLDGLTAEVTVTGGRLCHYSFTAQSVNATSSSILSVLGSTHQEALLPPLSQAITLDQSPVDLDIAALLAAAGYTLPPEYILDETITVDGNEPLGLVQKAEQTVIQYQATSPTWNRILFTLTHEMDETDKLLGSLYITVSDNLNRPPAISNPVYRSPTHATMNRLAFFDLANSPDLTISDPDGDEWQLIEVQSPTTQVSATEPDNPNNTAFTFQATAVAEHVVSYIVGDHNGGFSAGTYRVTVDPNEQMPGWADIELPSWHLYFEATPLYSKAVQGGVTPVAVWDSGVNNTIAGMNYEQAQAYCSGRRLPTKAELDALLAVPGQLDAYPRARSYIATEGENPISYDIATGTTSSYTPISHYVMCTSYSGVGSITYSPCTNSAVADGGWHPLGQVTSEGVVDEIRVISSQDAGPDPIEAAKLPTGGERPLQPGRHGKRDAVWPRDTAPEQR